MLSALLLWKSFFFTAITIYPSSCATGAFASEILTIYADDERDSVRLLTGFLHGINDETPTNLFTVLKPTLWRKGGYFDQYERIVNAGAIYEYVLSDAWGYHGPWPWEDWNAWDSLVHYIVTEAKDSGMEVYWDVWNEPNSGYFWQGTREQFFETYRRAFNGIRAVDSGAIVGGPSLAWFDTEFLGQFLQYCKENYVEVNFVSWHELDDLPSEDIIWHALGVRNVMKDSSFKELNMKEIHINEWGGSGTSFAPGVAILFFHHLEVGNVDRAAHAIWGVDWWLDGLLMPDNQTPRAVYWAWKAYADAEGIRLGTATTNPLIQALAVIGKMNLSS